MKHYSVMIASVAKSVQIKSRVEPSADVCLLICRQKHNADNTGYIKKNSSERIREVVIQRLGKITPEFAASMSEAVDVAHRVGRKEGDQPSQRGDHSLCPQNDP
ncbi:hypothetical protein QTP70_032264 [Hemibagrus guttatus]|uniref:Uncharacterized protein n=1 Tax=Hemibagrus guttatus TaxID=175788 RepID=A0AAE0QI69_9TELE|nr:hypothetical protein QTP70_032264 [Hemibagrus guttatus]